MLCMRSASFMNITLKSLAIAKNVFFIVSSCLSSHLYFILETFTNHSHRFDISNQNFFSISCLVILVSSITSCNRHVCIDCISGFKSINMRVDFIGCIIYGSHESLFSFL